MTQLKVPVICLIIGEGASGGALGIGVGDRLLMCSYSWYSVISPESCSSILWRSWEYKEQAAAALKLTAKDLEKVGLIDGIINEPLGGAHDKPEKMTIILKKAIIKHTKELEAIPTEERVKRRIKKYSDIGEFIVHKEEELQQASPVTE